MTRTRKAFTEQETQYIKDNYHLKDIHRLSEELDRTYTSILSKIRRIRKKKQSIA